MVQQRPTTTPSSGTRVIPLRPSDTWQPIDCIRNRNFFILPGHNLNEELMYDSLNCLIRDHLPILGARIHQSATNKFGLEYWLPQTFADDDILFGWSSSVVDSSLEGVLPRVQDTPDQISWSHSIPELEEQWTPSTWPRQRVADTEDTPTFLVHITRYNDGAVLATNIPHVVSDQLGLRSVFNAWLQVAQGDKVTPFIQLRDDQFRGLKNPTPEDLQTKGRLRVHSQMGLARGMLGLVPELASQPGSERRLLYLPTSLVENLRNQHNATLKAKLGEKAPRLSSGDIVASICLKLTHLHRKKPKTICFTAAVNARGRHQDLPAGKPYLHNAVTSGTARFKISRETPLLEIAHRHRQAVLAGIEPSSADRDIAVMNAIVPRGLPYLIVEPGETLYSVSNWVPAWQDLDLSAFVEQQDDDSTSQDSVSLSDQTTIHAESISDSGRSAVTMEGSPGTIPLVLGTGPGESTAFHRFSGFIMDKARGGYWLDHSSSVKNAALLEKLFACDPTLETL